MRELLNTDGDDGGSILNTARGLAEADQPLVVEHRLSILRDLAGNEPELEPLADLYPSVKPKKDTIQRVHLSRKRESPKSEVLCSNTDVRRIGRTSDETRRKDHQISSQS